MYDLLLVCHGWYSSMLYHFWVFLMLNSHDLEIWIRGQWRTFKLVPFESLGAASYSHFIVTMAVSLVILQEQQYMFGVKRLLKVEKVLLMRKNLVIVLFRRLMQRSQQSILSCGLTGVWWHKCLNEFGRYVEKWNVNVWRLRSLLTGAVSYSPSIVTMGLFASFPR